MACLNHIKKMNASGLEGVAVGLGENWECIKGSSFHANLHHQSISIPAHKQDTKSLSSVITVQHDFLRSATMYQLAQMIVLAALSALSSALPQSSQGGGGLQGYGTFNVYSSQNTKNCDGLFGEQTASGGARFSPMFRNTSTKASFTGQGTEELAKNAQNNIYQAAISDVSKGLGEYRCNYSGKDMQHDPNQW